MLGHLFESLVTVCVRVPAQAAKAQVCHLRTRNGDHEIDLILVRDDGRALAIEVKLSTRITDQDTKRLHWLADRLGDWILGTIIINSSSVSSRERTRLDSGAVRASPTLRAHPLPGVSCQGGDHERGPEDEEPDPRGAVRRP